MRALVHLVGVDNDTVLVDFARRILEVVVDNNRYLMQRYPGRVPPLHQSGVRFRPEPWAGQNPLGISLEQFCPFPELIQRGFADCAQLCTWLVAERREHGDPRAALRFYCRTVGEGPERRRFFHVQVRNGDGTIQDPSRLLDF